MTLLSKYNPLLRYHRKQFKRSSSLTGLSYAYIENSVWILTFSFNKTVEVVKKILFNYKFFSINNLLCQINTLQSQLKTQWMFYSQLKMSRYNLSRMLLTNLLIIELMRILYLYQRLSGIINTYMIAVVYIIFEPL